MCLSELKELVGRIEGDPELKFFNGHVELELVATTISKDEFCIVLVENQSHEDPDKHEDVRA